MWALMWTAELSPAEISPGCLTGRHLAFKYCLAPTIVITLSLEGREGGRFGQILFDRLKLTEESLEMCESEAQSCEKFHEIKVYEGQKRYFVHTLGLGVPRSAQLLVEQFVFGIQIDYFIDVVLLQSISGVLGLLRS